VVVVHEGRKEGRKRSEEEGITGGNKE